MLDDLEKAFEKFCEALELAEGTYFAEDATCGGQSRRVYDRIGECISAIDDDLEQLSSILEEAKEEK